MELARSIESQSIDTALTRSRVVALLGPRQCGKTTLARHYVDAQSSNYFDLEDPTDLARLNEPMTALSPLRGLVVIDEIQRRPDLFPILRVLVDRPGLPARFLILGSASHELLRQSSESLAGRIETIPIAGLRRADLGSETADRHWRRGGFPLSYLAGSERDSFAWRKEFIKTFLERDVPQFGIRIPAATLYRFWSLLAHYHGQIWNAAEAARALAVDIKTIGRYLDLLESLFMIRRLSPWHANLSKRQVKSPKIYFRDTGLLHVLLGITEEKSLLSHPKIGASWEGFVLEEALKATAPDEHYFWATHAGAELDLLMIREGRRIGIEIKRADAPSVTESMRVALKDLELDRLLVIYPGSKSYPLGDQIQAVPVSMLASPNAMHELVT